MYEFITIGGGEYYVDIFNGIAAIVRSGDFLNIVKIAATMAFMMALLNAALQNSLYDAGKWFLTIFIITQVLLYPRASVHVTDKTNPALMGARVDNVPFVVAYTASTSSQVGYSLTKLFETVFSLPDDLQYSENGMIFGVNLFQAMTQARITNSNLAASIDSFSKNCIFFDLQLGIYSFDDLKDADDIWSFVRSTQVENRFFTYVNRSGSVSYPTCKEGGQRLDADWGSEFLSPRNIAFFSKKPNLTQSVLSSVAPEMNEYFLNVSKSSQQILQQAMMINAINAAVESNEAESEVQLYQNTRAALQARSTYQTIGAQAGIWVPILKIVIETIFIGAFPLIVLLAFIPNFTGALLRGYLGTFFWLASWGPIYAILHRIAMGHAATYTLNFEGLTLYSQSGLDLAMTDIAAMAGYMSMFVPMLALGIARGGAAAMSSMTTSFMSAVQSSAATATHEGMTGNLSFGNVGIGSRQISSGHSIMNDAGQISRHNNNGSFSVDNSYAESRLGFELNGAQRIENSLSKAISSEESMAHSQAIQSQKLSAQGFEKAINSHRSIENSRGYEENFSAQEKFAFSNVNNATNDFAKEHNITREKSAEILGNISAGLGIGKSGENASANASLGANLQFVGRSSDSDLYKEATSFSEQRHLSKDFDTLKSAMQSNRFNISDTNAQSISQNFSESANLSKESGLHFENAQRLSEQMQNVKSNSFEFSQSFNNEFVHYLKSKYGSEGSVLDITDPNNLNKDIRNKEIAEFTSIKEKEIIDNSTRPDLEARYKSEAANFKGYSAGKNHYNFSDKYSSIDNSHLPSVTENKIEKTGSMIDGQTLDNSVIKKVKDEQEEGL